MNNFKFINENDDLGITPVENVFINHYMPNAPGDFVKIYLLGLKYCFNNNLASISNVIIAKTLNVLETDVNKAWSYWEKQGIISIERISEKDLNIRYYNIKSKLLSNSNFFINNDSNIKLDNSKNIEEKKRINNMNSMIERMYGRPLSSKEVFLFKEWIDEYGFSPEVIILLVEDCIKRGRKEINYLKQVAATWFDAGIKDYEQALNHITRNKEKWEKFFQIMKYLGFNRNPSRAEQMIMEKWFTKYNISLDLIYAACDKTLSIDKPNFKYIDTIITDWFKKEYKTVEDIKSDSSNNQKIKQKVKPKVTPLENQHEYDYDILEKKIEEKMWSEVDE